MTDRLISIVVAFLIGMFIGGWISYRVCQYEVMEIQNTYEEDLRRSKSLLDKQRESFSIHMKETDDKHYNEMQKVLNENKTLMSDVAAGRKRLRTAGVCPPPGNNSNTESSRLDNGNSPELEGEARQTYFSLIEDLTRMEKQLKAAQDIIIYRERANAEPGGK